MCFHIQACFTMQKVILPEWWRKAQNVQKGHDKLPNQCLYNRSTFPKGLYLQPEALYIEDWTNELNGMSLLGQRMATNSMHLSTQPTGSNLQSLTHPVWLYMDLQLDEAFTVCHSPSRWNPTLTPIPSAHWMYCPSDSKPANLLNRSSRYVVFSVIFIMDQWFNMVT